MVFQWFPMVANHWSYDGMVTIHRSGLFKTHRLLWFGNVILTRVFISPISKIIFTTDHPQLAAPLTVPLGLAAVLSLLPALPSRGKLMWKTRARKARLRKWKRAVTLLRPEHSRPSVGSEPYSSHSPSSKYIVFKIFHVSKKKPYFYRTCIICDKYLTCHRDETWPFEIYKLICESLLLKVIGVKG